MTKPLAGVRVVDLSQLTSGPFGTMVLAEQGADVVKVEPLLGDLARWTPNSRNGVSAYYLNQNRGKRSIAVDLQQAEARTVVLDLMAGADVVVQNFRPGVVERLGLGYDDVQVRNGGVVYVSISGYGPDGPYAARPVVDPIIQALTGIVYRQQSETIPLPDLVRNIFVDKATALTLAESVCAALYRRTRTGEGDHIEIPMLDVGLYFFWPDGMMDETLLEEDADRGRRIPDLYRISSCADGQFVYWLATPAQRHGLFRALGHPEWCDPSSYGDPAAMDDARTEELGQVLEDEFAALGMDELMDRLHEEGVPAAPVLGPDQVVEDPQVVHNGSLQVWEHPVAGRLRQPRHPVRFASSPTPVPEQAPGVGEHTDELLAQLGRTPEEVASLREAGAVA